MTSSIFSKNKKGNALIFQSLAWMLFIVLLTLFVSSQDEDYTSSAGGVPEEVTTTTLVGSFFSSAPVFVGLPAWVLSIYGILLAWGLFIAISWGLAVLHGF